MFQPVQELDRRVIYIFCMSPTQEMGCILDDNQLLFFGIRKGIVEVIGTLDWVWNISPTMDDEDRAGYGVKGGLREGDTV